MMKKLLATDNAVGPAPDAAPDDAAVKSMLGDSLADE